MNQSNGNGYINWTDIYLRQEKSQFNKNMAPSKKHNIERKYGSNKKAVNGN